MKFDIEQVSIIGSGNVANRLAIAFTEEGVAVSHIFSINQTTAKELAQKVGAKVLSSINDLPKQLCIVCVPDDVLNSVVDSINDDVAVAYTSGSIQISSFKSRKNLGVFYPLQTFSKERKVDFFNIPIFIESNSDYFTSILFDLAWKISREVNHANSEDRKKMHIAAVIVNNFTNHLVHLSQKYAIENKIDFAHLQPLLQETIAKLVDNSAFDSQTGPARRGDENIIEKHLAKLSGRTKEIYQLLSQSITETYSKND